MPRGLYRVVLSDRGGAKSRGVSIHQRGPFHLRALPHSKGLFGLRLRERGVWGLGRVDQPGAAVDRQPREVPAAID